MWRLMLAAVGCVAIEGDSCEKPVLESVRVLLVIDGSGSVMEEDFKNQIRLANTVLSGVRSLYSAYKNDTVQWQWAAIQFAIDVEIIADMHLDTGPLDIIDESLPRMCPKTRLPQHAKKCSTHYQPVLTKARDLLSQGGASHPFLWFLTDGSAQDLPTPEKMRDFRSSLFKNRAITHASVFLSRKTSESSNAVLQALSCPDTNPECSDRVLVGRTSEDSAVFSQTAQRMFRDVIQTSVPVSCGPQVVSPAAPSATSVAVVAIAAAIAVMACCCVVVTKKKIRQKPMDEERMRAHALCSTHVGSRPAYLYSGGRLRQGRKQRR